MDNKSRVQQIMDAMPQGQVAPLFDAMAGDVTWRWMGVGQWSREFEGKQLVVDKLFGGTPRRLVRRLTSRFDAFTLTATSW